MNIVHVIILSVIEGVSEFLPISSTGHLVLTAKVLGIVQSEFVKSFMIFIQLGAICAIVVLYRNTFFTRKHMLIKICTAFVPTAIVGFVLYPLVKNILLGNEFITLTALFLGGIAFILLEKQIGLRESSGKKISSLTNTSAILIGLLQSISMIPGVSRSAATIFGGMLVGLDRQSAVEFSFLLAVPTMVAAIGLDLLKSQVSFDTQQWTLLIIGFCLSFLCALVTVRFLLSFIKTHTFIPFGIYRIFLAIMYFIFIY